MSRCSSSAEHSKVPLKVRSILFWCMSGSPHIFHSALNAPVLAHYWFSSVRWAEDAPNPFLRHENSQSLSSVCCSQLIHQLHSWWHQSESRRPLIGPFSIFLDTWLLSRGASSRKRKDGGWSERRGKTLQRAGEEAQGGCRQGCKNCQATAAR